MMRFSLKNLGFLLLLGAFGFLFPLAAQDMSQTIYQFEMQSLAGEPVSLQNYEGKVVVLVNTASRCGLTPQYADLQETYKAYKDKGLVVLGFPANNFAGQEPGTDAEIQNFCQLNYGVDFPMFSKISVKGEDQHPLYQFLTSKEQNGVLDATMQWNFQKFLVDKQGKVVAVIPPTTKIDDPEVIEQIEGLLN